MIIPRILSIEQWTNTLENAYYEWHTSHNYCIWHQEMVSISFPNTTNRMRGKLRNLSIDNLDNSLSGTFRSNELNAMNRVCISNWWITHYISCVFPSAIQTPSIKLDQSIEIKVLWQTKLLYQQTYVCICKCVCIFKKILHSSRPTNK